MTIVANDYYTLRSRDLYSNRTEDEKGEDESKNGRGKITMVNMWSTYTYMHRKNKHVSEKHT
jgi:hypothetical protein